MAKTVKTSYLSLKSMFEQGNVSRMRDLQQLFPTSLSRDLNMNHGRYIDRLLNPSKFTFQQIFKFASIINIDVKLVTDVIVSELKKKYSSSK